MRIRDKMRRFFEYFRPLLEGNDGRVSLRSTAAAALVVDFIINTHNSVNILTRILKMVNDSKTISEGLVAAMSSNLTQIILLLGIEVGLITALLALKTIQNNAEIKAGMSNAGDS